jgi:MoaA/NifB/PqqE/SkfB family radical SAM enzyme
MNPVLNRLRMVVVYPYARCNCRCTMCEIWKRTEGSQLSEETYAGYVRDFEELGVEWVVFSGGEPLMHTGLERLCGMTAKRGMRTTILTTGLLLERNAPWIAKAVDDVIVSLDGPPAIHDQIRGVPGGFAALSKGVQVLRRHAPGFPVSARCTVQSWNHGALRKTATAAREIGLDSISYLAADLGPHAFDHGTGWNAARIELNRDEIVELAAEIESLIFEWQGSGFVRESPEKLRRIAAHFRAHTGIEEPVAPRCNAPWVSAVIETDGTVRPCFFHTPIGRIGDSGLLRVLNSEAAVAFRNNLDVEGNEICRRCVCSLYDSRAEQTTPQLASVLR